MTDQVEPTETPVTPELTVEQLQDELAKAYRCIQGCHNLLKSNADFNNAQLAYHALTIAAARRFIYDGAMDGTAYFVDKPVSVLHEALGIEPVDAT